MLLLTAMITYKVFKNRLRMATSPKANAINTHRLQPKVSSKFAIVICVCLWMVSRIIYFSISYYRPQPS